MDGVGRCGINRCRNGGQAIAPRAAYSVPYTTSAISTPRNWSTVELVLRPFASDLDINMSTPPFATLSKPIQPRMLNSGPGDANGKAVPDAPTLPKFGPS